MKVHGSAMAMLWAVMVRHDISMASRGEIHGEP